MQILFNIFKTEQQTNDKNMTKLSNQIRFLKNFQ